MEQVRIVWNGQGGELDSRTVTETSTSNGTVAAEALREMLNGAHLCPGDSIIVVSLDD